MANGRSGRGSKLFDREEAEALVEELNREFPQILHEVVKSNSEQFEAAPTGRALEPDSELAVS